MKEHIEELLIQSLLHLIRDGALDMSLGNYHAIAALVAFLVALVTRHLFITIVAGLACFTLLKVFV